jgi:hypothetical protein
MGFAEEHSGALPDPNEHQTGSLFDGDVVRALWNTEKALTSAAFDRVRKEFQYMRSTYATEKDAQWQSFHSIVGAETTSIWLANRVVSGNETLHALRCEENDTDLRCTEYVLAADRSHWARKESAAHKYDEDAPWSPAMLGSCALIQVHEGMHIRLYRGASQPTLLTPRAYNLRDDSNDTMNLFEYNKLEDARQEAKELQELLGSLGTGAYHDAGVTGTLY